MRRVLMISLAAAASIAALSSTAAQAGPTLSGDSFAIGSFDGQDCPITGPNGSNGFSGCWATQDGIATSAGGDPTASRSVAQIGLTGTTDISTNYPTIDGSEFTLTLDTSSNTLFFTYLMGTGDPVLHYISIKQADGYELFYDAAGFASGTTYSFALNNYFLNNPGVSHITVYDSTGAVPEPATWGLMLLGFAGVGVAMRRKRKPNGALMQIA